LAYRCWEGERVALFPLIRDRPEAPRLHRSPLRSRQRPVPRPDRPDPARGAHRGRRPRGRPVCLRGGLRSPRQAVMAAIHPDLPALARAVPRARHRHGVPDHPSRRRCGGGQGVHRAHRVGRSGNL